eukprot:2416938-Rhodomonas_salina.1
MGGRSIAEDAKVGRLSADLFAATANATQLHWLDLTAFRSFSVGKAVLSLTDPPDLEFWCSSRRHRSRWVCSTRRPRAVRCGQQIRLTVAVSEVAHRAAHNPGSMHSQATALGNDAAVSVMGWADQGPQSHPPPCQRVGPITVTVP